MSRVEVTSGTEPAGKVSLHQSGLGSMAAGESKAPAGRGFARDPTGATSQRRAHAPACGGAVPYSIKKPAIKRAPTVVKPIPTVSRIVRIASRIRP